VLTSVGFVFSDLCTLSICLHLFEVIVYIFLFVLVSCTSASFVSSSCRSHFDLVSYVHSLLVLCFDFVL
jgi:hypothetical protein